MVDDSDSIKKMADLLRQGATLTKDSCPACFSPIFKLRGGDLWCAKCQKRVIIVKDGESEPAIKENLVFTNLEQTIMDKINKIKNQLGEESDPKKILTLGKTLSALLENLEKIV